MYLKVKRLHIDCAIEVSKNSDWKPTVIIDLKYKVEFRQYNFFVKLMFVPPDMNNRMSYDKLQVSFGENGKVHNQEWVLGDKEKEEAMEFVNKKIELYYMRALEL